MRTTGSLPSRLLLPIFHATCSGIWTYASIRGLHSLAPCRTPCGFAPQTPERVARTPVGTTFRATRGWARAPRHRIATRAGICSTDFCTYACGGFEDSAKIAKYWDEWYLSPPHRVAELVRKASTHRYLSFNPVTEGGLHSTH